MSSVCATCGAHYAADDDSCDARFHILLALDHSRRQPWGSRHGQAFSAFALQHPDRYPASVDRSWAALYRVYVEGQSSTKVFAELYASGKAAPGYWNTPPRSEHAIALPAVTIADLGDFDADTYPEKLDAWCRAALAMWTPARE